MISDKIKEARMVIDQVRTQESKAQREQKRREVSARIQGLVRQFDAYKESYTVLHGLDPVTFSNPQMHDVLRRINGLIQDLSADDFENVSVPSLQNPTSDLQQCWRQYVTHTTEGVSRVLHVVAPLSSLRDEIKRLEKSLAEFSDTWSVTKETVRDLKRSLSRADDIVKDFDATDEVQEFLALMSRGEATANDLSTHIMAWLREQGLAKKIRVSILP